MNKKFNDKRLVSNTEIFDENDIGKQEISIRPTRLNELIGQKQMKENLSVFIEAALSRNKPLDHSIFYGPPGLGKTSLAQIIAKEMGANFKSISGPTLSKAADLAAILTNLQSKDVLFIDEIHRLSTNIEEVLYSAMEDFSISIIIGEGPAARSIKIDLQPFTLVGATTRFGLLSKPLRDRFGITTRLNFYNCEELTQILDRAALIMKIRLTKNGSIEIAKRSRGTPRIALRLLNRVRDFAIVASNFEIDAKMADQALNKLEVDKFGLDSNDDRYLKFIIDKYNGGPVGIETLAAALSEQRDTIEEIIEPYLMQIGFLQKTPRGRIVTKAALEYLGLPIKNLLQMNMLNID